MDDFDALLATPRRRGRPTNAERIARETAARELLAEQAAIRAAAGGVTLKDINEFRMPVSQNFLAEVMNMDAMTVKKRLTRCRPAGTVGRRHLYYFHEAVHFLVKPKMNAEEFARSLNKADLPPEINKSFWDSQRSRVKYKIEFQEAWETEDVMRVLGEVAMLFKDSTTMVVEEMRNRAKLTDEQTEILQECIDELRKEIRQKLVDMPQTEQTPSMFGKPLWGVSEEIETEPDVDVLPFDDDDGDFE